MYYVYLIVEKDSQRRYIGLTNDLKRRLAQHNSSNTGSRFTRKGHWELIYYEAYRSKKDADMREYRLKHDGRSRRFLYERTANFLTG